MTTATAAEFTVGANYLKVKAATGTQPRCCFSGRRLPLAFNPGSAQLQQQRYSCPRLRARQAFPMLTSAAGMAASSGDVSSDNAAHVKAAFAEAGLSQDAIDHILTQYPAYLRWDVEQKLLPAMQRKQQELGASFPSAMRRTPKMLLRSGEVLAKAQIARKAAKAKAASGNASIVKAAFADAGLSQDAIDHILTRYPNYLRWDVEQKLLPAMQCWQQELGDRFLSEFERIPTLLHKQPAEEQLKDMYLASLGIKFPEILRKRNPHGFNQSLTSIQSKVAHLQQCGFTRAQTLSLIEQHPDVLSRSSEHVDDFLRVINDMFGCAQDKGALSHVLLSCRERRLFNVSVATLHQDFTYFCNCIGANDKEMQRAWKHGTGRASPETVDIRLHSLAAQLDSTLDEAKSVVRRMPQMSKLLPETVGLHVTQLLDLGFSHGQVKSMCLRQPVLLMYSFSSDVHVAKWEFLTCVLRLSHDAIAANPNLLMTSLPNRLGPRWAYLQLLRLHDLIAFTAAPQVFQSLLFLTDSKFRAAYTIPQLPVYDEHFQKQWQRRWDFLLVDQQLSIQDIGDNPSLLHISLNKL